jgi:hypothetical protein
VLTKKTPLCFAGRVGETGVGNLVVGDGDDGIGDGGTGSLGRLWPNAWGDWDASVEARGGALVGRILKSWLRIQMTRDFCDLVLAS